MSMTNTTDYKWRVGHGEEGGEGNINDNAYVCLINGNGIISAPINNYGMAA